MLLVLVFALLCLSFVESFSVLPRSPFGTCGTGALYKGFRAIDGLSLHARRRNLRRHGRSSEESEPIPMLPPAGLIQPRPISEFTSGTTPLNDSPAPHVVSPKVELQYTCNICETRNSHQMSRLAYTEGVVIAVCKHCKSKHLIADNLGWHNYDGGFAGNMNIEEYMASKGRENEVKRVSSSVFELREILGRSDGPKPTSGDDRSVMD
mmetsp:Transcript_119/g.178  ORF Transcript_119/g.178 Transcript_119/m.178 type:complete len:208 (+) Transcript_119:61-684(+)|eukprot:CAMPEP_0118701368 /NCGR_PEP_ID=MMETSP0800-20121206/17209_1 /TAXON_ID=210618 ORGANISM="Striatella unipunctata, Strain CCMP2910" /NCGR_SAMPLE_ID=MMETSP0800 /ASSEMBLY_ACC=CAM_ASM_000638 /LENGTH=207 /DNA_ID=CAMNT_0006602275 /DNA_START=37 /DNA_END=660 /DNA_ORIENTATION=-